MKKTITKKKLQLNKIKVARLESLRAGLEKARDISGANPLCGCRTDICGPCTFV